MVLTIFLSIVVCGAASLMMISGIAFIQDIKLFSSAPKEARDVLIPRDKELFYGARTIGCVLMIFSVLMILSSLAIAIWDGFRSGFTFWQFFTRLVIMFTVYKVYDMIFFDYFLLMKFHFFQHYYPEVESVLEGRKYGFNIKSQLLKLIVVFPVLSALAAWICTLFK
ncbi:MAG: hypothetical protein IJ072_04245 [Oscillospiraceae bacterium]|nr:hypothetical protein [Oscillospiraceae bacterium]